jgi:energy-coupling factor transporter ATP-binding protein EcfA2
MNEAQDIRAFAAVPAADILPDTVLQETFVDPLGIESFWERWYLQGFVDQGYGKVKLLVGKPGSGKTHFLQHFAGHARRLGYVVVVVDAHRDRISAIDEVYRAVAAQVEWDELLHSALQIVIRDELGYPEFDGAPEEFLPWAERVRDLSASLLRRDLREAIDKFLRAIDLEAEFLLALRVCMNDIALGQTGDVAQQWLLGEKVGATVRKGVGLKAPVTKRNARALVISLAALIHRLTNRGLVILIDNIDVLASTTRVDGRPYYTRAMRDQSYEMLREFLDESAFSPFLMTILAGDGEAVANPRTGFAAYPALWARLQTEVQSDRPNLFGDLVDLDRLWADDTGRLDDLASRWRAVTLRSGEQWRVSAANTTLGLEWGRPRRLVADVLSERLMAEEGER